MQGITCLDPSEAEKGVQSDEEDLFEEETGGCPQSDEDSAEAFTDSRSPVYSANAEALPKLPSFLEFLASQRKQEKLESTRDTILRSGTNDPTEDKDNCCKMGATNAVVETPAYIDSEAQDVSQKAEDSTGPDCDEGTIPIYNFSCINHSL